MYLVSRATDRPLGSTVAGLFPPCVRVCAGKRESLRKFPNGRKYSEAAFLLACMVRPPIPTGGGGGGPPCSPRRGGLREEEKYGKAANWREERKHIQREKQRQNRHLCMPPFLAAAAAAARRTICDSQLRPTARKGDGWRLWREKGGLKTNPRNFFSPLGDNTNHLRKTGTSEETPPLSSPPPPLPRDDT